MIELYNARRIDSLVDTLKNEECKKRLETEFLKRGKIKNGESDMKLIIKKNGEIFSQEEFKDYKLACNTLRQKAWQIRDSEISALIEEKDEDIDNIRISFFGVDKAFVKVYDTEYIFEIV